MSLISTPDIKKASNAEIIDTMKKMSDVLITRYEDSPDLDMDQVFRSLLSDSCFSNPDSIREPFVVNEFMMIAVPSVPRKGNSKKSSVVPMIQIPGSEPYLGYSPDTETYVDSQTVKYQGLRSLTLHKVIPGMIVSFHHFREDNGFNDRVRIDAGRIEYDDEGSIIMIPVDAEDALFNMPDPSKVGGRS